MREGKSRQQVLAVVHVAVPRGSDDSVDPVVLEVADRGDIWSLWQVPVSESQCKPLEFWGKILPSSEDNYSPFEKQLLAY